MAFTFEGEKSENAKQIVDSGECIERREDKHFIFGICSRIGTDDFLEKDTQIELNIDEEDCNRNHGQRARDGCNQTIGGDGFYETGTKATAAFAHIVGTADS